MWILLFSHLFQKMLFLVKSVTDIMKLPVYRKIAFRNLTVIELYIFLGWNFVKRNRTQIEGFAYQSSEDGISSVVDGVFSTYHGGGYAAELDLDHELARREVYNLEKMNWIDRYTRFVILEATVFNVNSRLFSRLKTYFEISKAGQVVSSHVTDSMRLYPYVEIGDYVMLAAQLLFIAVVIARLFFFIYSMTKCRFTAGALSEVLIEFVRLMLALGYVIFYIWRIDRTIYAIEFVMNNKGEYTISYL